VKWGLCFWSRSAWRRGPSLPQGCTSLISLIPNEEIHSDLAVPPNRRTILTDRNILHSWKNLGFRLYNCLLINISVHLSICLSLSLPTQLLKCPIRVPPAPPNTVLHVTLFARSQRRFLEICRNFEHETHEIETRGLGFSWKEETIWKT
jgi:hypothetical protein